MKKLSINGVSLNFIEKNIEQECAIIFLHGNSHSLKTFSKQMESPLLNNYRLISVDLPGHGKSSPLETYSVKILSQILSEFLKTLEIKKFIFAAHSLGGHIAINFLKTGMKPYGLFLFGTPPLKNPFDVAAFTPNPKAISLGKSESNYVEISTLMDEMNYVGLDKILAIEDFLNTDPKFRLGILDDIASGKNEDEVELIKSFDGAVMFLLATKDSLINNTYITQKCFANFSQVQYMEIETGHSPHVEMNVDFNRNLAAFCNKVFNEKVEIEFKNDRQHERSQNEQRN